MSRANPFSEVLLQWLWKNRYLQTRNLSTGAGKKVIIHHPGYPNPTDGPDFTNARITIGALMWHGDVEIHWTSNDWFSHNHHKDTNFNRVILHVIYNDSKPKKIRCQDQTVPPTLQMKPFLPEPLKYFFHHFRQPNRLPCAGIISSVPKAVIREQFEHAHQAYFEQKINDLLSYYDASFTLSNAWLRMLIIALFDGLGVSHNRTPMRRLGKLLLDEEEMILHELLTKKALRISGIKPENSNTSFQWKRKGSRPANHPETRIRQGCKMLYFIKNKSFSWWLRTDLEESFETMLRQVDTTPRIGTHQAGVLFGTVWVPAFYLLGELTGTGRLRSQAGNTWSNHRTALPASITKHFHQADIPPEVFEKKLGTVHQYRKYCSAHQCQQCKVFKHLISS